MKLGQLHASQGDAQAVRTLLSELRPLFSALPKAKTAKLVRALIEAISTIPDSTQLQVRCPTARQQAWFPGAAVHARKLFVSWQAAGKIDAESQADVVTHALSHTPKIRKHIDRTPKLVGLERWRASWRPLSETPGTILSRASCASRAPCAAAEGTAASCWRHAVSKLSPDLAAALCRAARGCRELVALQGFL